MHVWLERRIMHPNLLLPFLRCSMHSCRSSERERGKETHAESQKLAGERKKIRSKVIFNEKGNEPDFRKKEEGEKGLSARDSFVNLLLQLFFCMHEMANVDTMPVSHLTQQPSLFVEYFSGLIRKKKRAYTKPLSLSQHAHNKR